MNCLAAKMHKQHKNYNSFFAPFGGSLFNSDLKQSRPEFAGYIKFVVRLIVGDSIQHGFRILQFTFRHESAQIDPGSHMTILRIDRRDPIFVPDVRIDLAVHVFELVQLVHRSRTVDYVNRLRDFKISWVDEPDLIRTVAQNQRLSVSRKSPTLPLVIELTGTFERLRVVDKTDMVLPGKLVDFPVQHSDAFREVRLRHVDFFQDFAGLEFDSAQA